MLVQVLQPVPDSVFNPVVEEITNVNWDHVIDPYRRHEAFYSSKSIHIRHLDFSLMVDEISSNEDVEHMSTILDCVYHPINRYVFGRSLNMANWMYEQVGGIGFGRIMVVRLEPRGEISLHVDPMNYFEVYSRYHVPLKTNPHVLFSSGPDTPTEHMPQQHLCRLNNRLPHMLVNDSDEIRIHLIADIAVEGGNQIF
jgi:hypothetical protein